MPAFLMFIIVRMGARHTHLKDGTSVVSSLLSTGSDYTHTQTHAHGLYPLGAEGCKTAS